MLAYIDKENNSTVISEALAEVQTRCFINESCIKVGDLFLNPNLLSSELSYLKDHGRSGIIHKFRGISELDGELVYGDLVHGPSLNEVYIQELETSKNGNKQKIKTPVKPDSISTFTNIADHEGNELYTGDILKSMKGRYFIIVEAKGGAALMTKKEYSDLQKDYPVVLLDALDKAITDYFIKEYCTKAGDVFFNPELISEDLYVETSMEK